MKLSTIHSFEDFCDNLDRIGFTIGGKKGRGIFTLADYYGAEIRPFTGDPDTDPREWRQRVLEERDDIAYGKVFFRQSGYITQRWYPFFLAARQEGRSAAAACRGGYISRDALHIYTAVAPGEQVSLIDLRKRTGFSPTKEQQQDFEKAVVELQSSLYLTICRTAQRQEGAGWSSSFLCRSEDFFPPWVWEQAANLSLAEAVQSISEQIQLLKPRLTRQQLQRFLWNR